MTTHPPPLPLQPLPPLAPTLQRLSKAVAAQVPCSRREAEQLIVEGWVRVDGVCKDLPETRVAPEQRIEIDPQACLQPAQPATLLLHKPAGVALSLAGDWLQTGRWADDPSGIPARRAHRVGLQPLLPMPLQASGLCVFSQDVRVVRKLTEDAAWLEQEWVVDVTGNIDADGLERLRLGLHLGSGAGSPLGDRVLVPVRVSWQSENRLRFALKGIPPESLDAMCAAVGLQWVASRRLRIGRVALAGLPPGQWRYWPPGERF